MNLETWFLIDKQFCRCCQTSVSKSRRWHHIDSIRCLSSCWGMPSWTTCV